MTRQYPDLPWVVLVWSGPERNVLQPIRSITKIWVVIDISMRFLRSFLRRHFALKPVVASRNVGCFLRLPFCAQIKQLAWPLALPMGHRKSRLVLPARFPIAYWRSRSVAKSAWHRKENKLFYHTVYKYDSFVTSEGGNTVTRLESVLVNCDQNLMQCCWNLWDGHYKYVTALISFSCFDFSKRSFGSPQGEQVSA